MVTPPSHLILPLFLVCVCSAPFCNFPFHFWFWTLFVIAICHSTQDTVCVAKLFSRKFSKIVLYRIHVKIRLSIVIAALPQGSWFEQFLNLQYLRMLPLKFLLFCSLFFLNFFCLQSMQKCGLDKPKTFQEWNEMVPFLKMQLVWGFLCAHAEIIFIHFEYFKIWKVTDFADVDRRSSKAFLQNWVIHKIFHTVMAKINRTMQL